MKSKTIKGLDLKCYYQKLTNGLEVIIVPMDFSKTYVSFATKCGSKNLKVKIDGQEKTFPTGIAHFLEHKLFEVEKGIKTFDFYAKSGTSCNAYTGYDRTVYLFDGPNNFKHNLKFLINYVQTPYFTDENIKKEQGIINEERKIYADHVYNILNNKSLANTFSSAFIRYPIIGLKEDIYRINKADLDLFYQVFYHPSNMFIVVTGKADPKETIKIIEETFANKKSVKPLEYKNIKPFEKKAIVKKKEIVDHNVKTPKLAINYKVAIGDIKNKKSLGLYLDIFLKCKYDWQSNITKELHDKKLIEEDLMSYSIREDKYFFITIIAESKQPMKVLKIIRESIQNFDIEEELFLRKRKNFLSHYLRLPNYVSAVNQNIVNQMIEHGEINDNYYEQMASLNYKTFKKIITNLDFSNNNYVLLKKLAKQAKK